MKIKLVRLNFSMEPINFEELTQTKLAKILINICLSSEFSEFEELIFECSWIILNGLSGDSTIVREFIELGVIDVLKKQINSENVLLREQVKIHIFIYIYDNYMYFIRLYGLFQIYLEILTMK